MRAYSCEGAIAIAVAAIDAQKFDEAREQLKRVLRSEPTQRAFLLMADLEEREHGDQGRIREWLSRAVRAPHDKVWIADGVVSANWAPVSPKTGRVDAYEWATPESAIDQDQTIEVIDDKLFEPPELAAPVQVLNEPVAADIVVPPSQKTEKPAAADKSEAVEPVSATEAAKETPAPDKKPTETSKADKPRATVVPVGSSGSATDKADQKAAKKVEEPPKAKPDAASKTGKKPEVEKETLVEFPLSHLPDDPGLDADDDDPKAPKEQGFRFFR